MLSDAQPCDMEYLTEQQDLFVEENFDGDLEGDDGDFGVDAELEDDETRLMMELGEQMGVMALGQIDGGLGDDGLLGEDDSDGGGSVDCGEGEVAGSGKSGSDKGDCDDDKGQILNITSANESQFEKPSENGPIFEKKEILLVFFQK